MKFLRFVSVLSLNIETMTVGIEKLRENKNNYKKVEN